MGLNPSTCHWGFRKSIQS